MYFLFSGFCFWLISVAPGKWKWKCLGLRPQLSKVEFPLNTRCSSAYTTHNPTFTSTSISISRL